MKKKVISGILPIFAALFLLAVPAQAAQGTWLSDWGYDLNASSSIGTTNASADKGYFQLRVVLANGTHVGNHTVQLSQHQSGKATFTGSGLRDKQGQVLCSPQYYHTPWFNS